jgi:hypothetical protein
LINWKNLQKNIPSSIKVGKNDYFVLWVTDFPKDHTQLGQSSFGEEKQIIININQPTKEAVLTFFHEVLHCISYEYKVNLTEKQVLAMEKGFKDILLFSKILDKGRSDARNQRKRLHSRKIR